MCGAGRALTRDVVLFYFAGHGGYADGSNWLADAQARRLEDGLSWENDILPALVGARDRQVVVALLDACRTDLQQAGGPVRHAASGLPVMQAQELAKGRSDVHVAFPISHGALEDGTASALGNSLFATAVMQNIALQRTEVREFLKLVAKSTALVSGAGPEVWHGSSGGQKYCLAGESSARPAPKLSCGPPTQL